MDGVELHVVGLFPLGAESFQSIDIVVEFRVTTIVGLHKIEHVIALSGIT